MTYSILFRGAEVRVTALSASAGRELDKELRWVTVEGKKRLVPYAWMMGAGGISAFLDYCKGEPLRFRVEHNH